MGEIVLYAKKSCTQCKKAIAFLNKKGIQYQVKDIVHEPPPRSLLEKVIKAENIYASLNQRSTTYKSCQLGKRRTTKNEAIRLMLKDPNLIKRPLIIKDNRAYQGFDERSLMEFISAQQEAARSQIPTAAPVAAPEVPVVPTTTLH